MTRRVTACRVSARLTDAMGQTEKNGPLPDALVRSGSGPEVRLSTTRVWRNWQTQRSLKPPPSQDCGFEPRRPHA